MSGCLGCLGLLVVLGAFIWPIAQLRQLFGWSDVETSRVAVAWLALLIFAANKRRPNSKQSVAVRDVHAARAAVERSLNRTRPASVHLEGRSTQAIQAVAQGQPPEPIPRTARARDPIPAQLRFSVLQRDGFRCRYCGRTGREPGVVLHVDHVVPHAAGGATSEDNLLTACQSCNLGKSTRGVV